MLELLDLVAYDAELAFPSDRRNRSPERQRVVRVGEPADALEPGDHLSRAGGAVFGIRRDQAPEERLEPWWGRERQSAERESIAASRRGDPIARLVTVEGAVTEDAPRDGDSEREEVATAIGLTVVEDLRSDERDRPACASSRGGRLELGEAEIDDADVELGCRESAAAHRPVWCEQQVVGLEVVVDQAAAMHVIEPLTDPRDGFEEGAPSRRGVRVGRDRAEELTAALVEADAVEVIEGEESEGAARGRPARGRRAFRLEVDARRPGKRVEQPTAFGVLAKASDRLGRELETSDVASLGDERVARLAQRGELASRPLERVRIIRADEFDDAAPITTWRVRHQQHAALVVACEHTDELPAAEQRFGGGRHSAKPGARERTARGSGSRGSDAARR